MRIQIFRVLDPLAESHHQHEVSQADKGLSSSNRHYDFPIQHRTAEVLIMGTHQEEPGRLFLLCGRCVSAPRLEKAVRITVEEPLDAGKRFPAT